MVKYALLGLFAVLVSGCQTPAPEAVAASQVPPSKAVRNEFLKVARHVGIDGRQLRKAQISSVVLLDPQTETYAFCVRSIDKSPPHYMSVNGISMRNGKLLGSTIHDYRCRDKRLRYYNFPEYLNLKS